jgi:hypothetical protein
MRVLIWIAAALLLAAGAVGPAAMAKDTLVLGVTLEPDHLDPTAGAAPLRSRAGSRPRSLRSKP